MSEPRTCHLPHITAFFCIAASAMTELEGRR